MYLYHGSDHKIPKPLYDFGKNDNDYGRGFYTTKDYVKAGEWAVTNGSKSSFVNKYEIDESNLNIVNLDKYGILSWIAEIVENRGARGELSTILGEKIVEKYKIDLSDADIIIGYRADDSYIDIVDSFLVNELSIEEVEKLFRKGELGQQVFIKSEKAFNKLVFRGADEIKDVDYINDDEVRARIEVSRFIKNRKNQILLNKFVPYGITAVEAVNNNYRYNEEYKYYEQYEPDLIINNIEEDNDNRGI